MTAGQGGQSAENDAPLAHGPDCKWDEAVARMWCGREHDARWAAYRDANPSWWRRLLTRSTRHEAPQECSRCNPLQCACACHQGRVIPPAVSDT